MIGRRIGKDVAMGWALALVVGGLSGCAGGSGPEFTTQAYDGGPPNTSNGDDDNGDTGSITTGGMGPADDGSDDRGEDPDTGPTFPDGGDCQDDSDCILPEGTCLEVQGHCDGGTCEHGAAAPGVACDDDEPCTVSDACDGEGVCFGLPLDCGGGECIDGECIDKGCPKGFADCNGDSNDGCEVELGTDSDCGGCGDACVTGEHAIASCNGGACDYQCEAPWDNCDGDWANGCEIPVGQPHQCDAGGINPTSGCWTPYCGNSMDPQATNFGTFYCMNCSTCRVPAAGQCQWCDSSTGEFFPVDTCGCGMFEDVVCS